MALEAYVKKINGVINALVSQKCKKKQIIKFSMTLEVITKQLTALLMH